MINQLLTLRLDHVHSSKLLGETIRPSSFCRELSDARVTNSTSIFVPLWSHVPISNHPSMTIIGWWQRRWRRQRIRGCCTHRGGRSARRLIAWMAIEKWITPCTTCAGCPWWSRQVKPKLYRDKGNGPLETLPLTLLPRISFYLFLSFPLSFCLPFVSINYNAHSWFFIPANSTWCTAWHRLWMIKR